MPTAIGPYLNSLLSPSRDANGAGPSTPSLAQTLSDNERESSRKSPSATVTLSEAAKARLAGNDGAAADAIPLASITKDARAWFNQQYRTLNISSAMLDGEVAVDLTTQARETLSAVASNAQGLFNADERAAAGIALQSRFDDAMAPHVVIAKHTNDYVSLYEAAAAYLEQAGADERATKIWQDQKQAVVQGLVAAKTAPDEAPDIGDRNDPVRALLDKAADGDSSESDASTASVAAKARAMLDGQIDKARANGTELSLRQSRTVGQRVDFSDFDNRTLAVVVLDAGSKFSNAETRAAKGELDQRTRVTMLSALTSGNDSAQGNLNLLQAYASMSGEEKTALGVTEDVTNRMVQNYRKVISIQNALGNGGASAGIGTPPSFSAYL